MSIQNHSSLDLRSQQPVRGRRLGVASRPSFSSRSFIGAMGLSLVFLGGCAGLPGGLGSQPAWLTAPPPPREGPIVEPGALVRETLPNGLEIMVLEDHRLPSLVFGLQLRQGAGSVDPTQAGVAEVAAEVMQRGAGERDALALARIVEDAGASLSVSVGWDTTGISISGLSEDGPLLMDILEDVSKRPRFEKVEFDKALAEQQASLVAATDDPATLVRWNAVKALYPGHRYGLPRSGTSESLARVDVAAARAYWTDRFVPRNAILWAAGDLSASEFVAQAKARFGGLEDVPPPAHTPAPPAITPTERRIVVVDKPELGQARIIVTHEGMARTDPKRIPADLMNDALGGSGFSSRLMQTIRSDAGLTYGVGSGFSMRREPGPFSVSTFTRVPEVRRVVDMILDEMRGIQGDRAMSEEERAKFVSYNVGRFGLSLETSRAVLGSLIDLEVFGLPDDSLDTYRGRVRAVTAADLAEAAETRLHPERAAIVVLGPADQLVPQLEDLGSVEVWQP